MPHAAGSNANGAVEPNEVERLLDAIAALVVRRQELQDSGAAATELDGNRRQIVRLQWELSRAVIDRHAASAGASGGRAASAASRVAR
jgi:hypothetical protein